MQPLSEAEKAQITDLVKEAMGFSRERGDTLNVVNSPFTVTDQEAVPELPLWKQPEMIELAQQLGKNVLIGGLVLYLVLGVLRPIAEAHEPTGSAIACRTHAMNEDEPQPMICGETESADSPSMSRTWQSRGNWQGTIRRWWRTWSGNGWPAMNEEGIQQKRGPAFVVGRGQAVQVLKHLSPLEVQKLGTAMAKLKNLSMGQIDAVLSDFCSRIVAEPLFLDLDPESYARTVLERALGEDKSTDNISRILEGQRYKRHRRAQMGRFAIRGGAHQGRAPADNRHHPGASRSRPGKRYSRAADRAAAQRRAAAHRHAGRYSALGAA